MLNKIRFLLLLVALALPAFAQQNSTADRLNELRHLRGQLRQNNSWRDADVAVIFGERVLSEAARQWIGLEVELAEGSVLRLTSVTSEIKTGAALVKLGVQTKSSVTLNLELSGRITSGEIVGETLRLPYRVTDVKLANGKLSSLFVKTLFGAWLTPERWNDELPPLEIPLRFADAMQVPASKFDVDGSLPMEIVTPAYQMPMAFAFSSLLVLDKRAVLTLRMGEQVPPPPSTVSTVPAGDDNIAALESEIARLSEGLKADGDLRIRLSRRVVNTLIEQLAKAQTKDFDIKLKPGRLRLEEVNSLVKVTNFTDVESGQGQADVNQLSIEKITEGKINLRLGGQGELDARINGREYGVPYHLSPHLTFAINNQIVPLQFVSENDRLLLRAVPGAIVPINLRFSLNVAGRDIGINRTLEVQADRWLNRIELPNLLNQEIPMPRKITVDKEGNLTVTQSGVLRFIASRLRVGLVDDALEMTADLTIRQP